MPSAAATPPRDPRAQPALAVTPAAGPDGRAWPAICDQFGLQMLVLAEQLRTSLDELEADEADPERLKRLYQVDHAVTQMRRACRDLRTLAGRGDEETAGFTTSLLDVIRMAASGIERYTQVTVGRVTELAVLGYAADDVGSLLAALLDNATRYSPGPVTVSCHLLDDGGAMFRVEDTGIGLSAEQVSALNTILAGPVPEVEEQTGRHSGFPVVHRIARKHSIGVRLAARPQPSSGTVAMVTLPPHLLCEDPARPAQYRAAPAAAPGPAAAVGPLADEAPGQRPTVAAERPVRPGRGARAEPTRPQEPPLLQPQPPQPQPPQHWEQAGRPLRGQPAEPGLLPRRQPASRLGARPQPAAPTAQQRAAARYAFADELSAFTQGASREPYPAADHDASTQEPTP